VTTPADDDCVGSSGARCDGQSAQDSLGIRQRGRASAMGTVADPPSRPVFPMFDATRQIFMFVDLWRCCSRGIRRHRVKHIVGASAVVQYLAAAHASCKLHKN
jgi:hypothetical protein